MRTRLNGEGELTLTAPRAPFQTTITALREMRGTFEVAAYTDVDGNRITGLPFQVSTVQKNAKHREWLPVSKRPDGSLWTAHNGATVSLDTGHPLVVRQVAL